jgi:cap2 methyltransferase
MLTIAWLKMFEMLSFIQDKGFLPAGGPLRTAHVCEAPGGFICATNHFLQTKLQNVRWTWTALSLNPWYEGSDEMVDSDAFIVKSLPNWEFGADNTGNIMNKDNILAFRRKALEVSLVDLITGDGGIGCDENPEEQERMTGRLVMYEVIAGIGVLKPGGCMIIKMFTTFTPCSFACVAFIASLFRRCYMLKPATSKASNSEIYVVGCDFLGLPSERWYSSLLDTVSAANLDARSLLSSDLVSVEWRRLFETASVAFADLTIFNLHRILAFVEPRKPGDAPIPKEVDIQRVKSRWSEIFGRRHSIANLPAQMWIVQKQVMRVTASHNASAPVGIKRMRTVGDMEDRRDANKLRESILSGDVGALEQNSSAGRASAPDITQDPKFARMLGKKAGPGSAPGILVIQAHVNDDEVISGRNTGHPVSSLLPSFSPAPLITPSEPSQAMSSLAPTSSAVTSIETPSTVLDAILGAQRTFGDRSGIGLFSAASAPVRLHCSDSDLEINFVSGAPFNRIVHSKFCSKKHPAVESPLTLVLTLAQTRLMRQSHVEPKHDSKTDRPMLHCGKIAQVLTSSNALPELLTRLQADGVTILNG